MTNKKIIVCSICGTKWEEKEYKKYFKNKIGCCTWTCECSDTETICYKHLEEECTRYGKEKVFNISCDQESATENSKIGDFSNKKITIGDLTKLYKEQFYSIELRNNLTGEILKPLKYDYETDLLTIEGFRFYLDDKNVSTLMIAIDKKQYQQLFNQIKEME